VTIDSGAKSGWSESLQGGSGADSLIAASSSANDTLQGFASSTTNASNDTLVGGDNTCHDHFVLGDVDGNAYGNGLGGLAFIRNFTTSDTLDLQNRNDYSFTSGVFMGGDFNTELFAGSSLVAYINDTSNGLNSSSSLSYIQLH
jgi:hypothetical protein